MNKQYPRGKIDEYTAKKLFDDAARHSFINPFPLSEQKSVASQSVIGDIEKLLTLPSNYIRLYSGLEDPNILIEDLNNAFLKV